MTRELNALVETVARAMKADADSFDDWETKTDEELKRAWLQSAAVAIRCVAEATRDASEGMENAAPRRPPGYGGAVTMYAGIWRAMHAASVLGEALHHD